MLISKNKRYEAVVFASNFMEKNVRFRFSEKMT